MGWESKGTPTPRFPLWGVVSAFQPPYLLSKSSVPGALTHQTTVLFFRDVVGVFFFFLSLSKECDPGPTHHSRAREAGLFRLLASKSFPTMNLARRELLGH